MGHVGTAGMRGLGVQGFGVGVVVLRGEGQGEVWEQGHMISWVGKDL